MNSHSLPYRFNVGIALFNDDGRVLIARRLRDDGPEIIYPGHEWQMPQGGVDAGEDTEAAARRELWEETGVVSADLLALTDAWLPYEFPPFAGPAHKLTAFRGQMQRWAAMRFTGRESEIDVTATRNGEEPEFDLWRWERLEAAVDLVVPFKRATYAAVAELFAAYTRR